ncbi:MAG: hypothetical protein ACK5MQ_09535 [Pikeienuella sp.]
MSADEEALWSLSETAAASGAAFLTPLGPMIMAAARLGAASDSRGFARRFGVAHALVIRECVSLAEDLGLIAIEDRGGKSQRLFFELTERGRRLCGEH